MGSPNDRATPEEKRISALSSSCTEWKPNGQCTEIDFAIIKGDGMQSSSYNCGLSSFDVWSMKLNENKFDSCMSQLGLSSSCAECTLGQVNYAIRNCFWDCITGDQNKCKECNEANGPTFKACTGTPKPSSIQPCPTPAPTPVPTQAPTPVPTRASCAWNISDSSCLEFTEGPYAVGGLGVQSCPEGFDVIDDSEDCQQAANFFNHQFTASMQDAGGLCFFCGECLENNAHRHIVIPPTHGKYSKRICRSRTDNMLSCAALFAFPRMVLALSVLLAMASA